MSYTATYILKYITLIDYQRASVITCVSRSMTMRRRTKVDIHGKNKADMNVYILAASWDTLTLTEAVVLPAYDNHQYLSRVPLLEESLEHQNCEVLQTQSHRHLASNSFAAALLRSQLSTHSLNHTKVLKEQVQFE